MSSESGNSTNSATKAAKVARGRNREPETPQRVDAGEHHFHQPARMRGAVKGQRQLQHVLEIGSVSTA